MEANRTTPIRDVVPKDGQARRILNDEIRDKFIQNHFILNQLSEKAKLPKDSPEKYPADGCTSALNPPPMYLFNAKTIYESGSINLHANRSPMSHVKGGEKKPNPVRAIDTSDGLCDVTADVSEESDEVIGLDCSGFLGTAFAAGGLKFFKGQKGPSFAICSRWIEDKKDKPDSCMTNVPFSLKDGSGLKEGDLINVGGHHVVMVDRVGPDPFGVEKALREKKSCSAITVSDFNFSILHSSAIGSWGIFRTHINIYESALNKDGKKRLIARMLEDLARQICETSKRNGTGTIVAPNFKKKYPFSVLRHKAEPACFFPETGRYPFRNEACVEKCFPKSG